MLSKGIEFRNTSRYFGVFCRLIAITASAFRKNQESTSANYKAWPLLMTKPANPLQFEQWRAV